ncbi:YdeI/OmpD-associated family protein [Pedobacter africanus]|uniref:Uncharacterized conserved protein YdeI, YjbR/CyaY-like superfamily, DUF1801 family n=1 Tax=Pedobacter africanus TaxID=151894 RepID=A0A1W2DDC3_9SPHI|nr:DUF1801 domain-containing protein [Pedobacter africanus]SMC95495.1 Uncharacterized conserved protein YdeI, YjbR/CyaY-like superfamily, DUF1801 family [Pedobacter africanus]
MEKYDARIETYINASAGFAHPILRHLRKLIHQASDEIRETIKWGFPHFEYKGTVCSMASFKAHCAFGFWKSTLLDDPAGILGKEKEQAMGQLGRITAVSDLPDDAILTAYIKNAVRLNEEGVKLIKKPAAEKKVLEIPDYFLAGLSAVPPAIQNFNNFSPSQKKEYIEWITEAKTEATREKRLKTAAEWISEGKHRNWKYER